MLRRIEQSADSLSRAEARAARWILAHPRQAIESSLARVAKEAGISEPTVVRFCRRLGLDGFRELKIRLAEAMSRPASYAHRDVLPDDTTGDAVAKVVDSSIQSLIELRVSVSAMPLEEVVGAMASARQIIFSGLGASGNVARDACQKFFRLGIPCALATDGPTILQSAAIAQPADVFVFVSHTGRNTDVIRAATLAQARSTKVVALTDGSSPLAAEATYLLECHAAEDTSLYTPMGSRLAQLAILDALQVALALRLGDHAAENLRRTKDALQ